MTAKQNTLYWVEWNKTRAILTRSGYTQLETEEWRRDVTTKACGKYKSSRDLTNRDLDLVLSHFRAVSRPDDLDEQIRLTEAEDERLRQGIRQDSPGDEWLLTITRAIYGHTRPNQWEELPTKELLKLRRRCANAARQARQAAEIENISTLQPENSPASRDAAEFRSMMEPPQIPKQQTRETEKPADGAHPKASGPTPDDWNQYREIKARMRSGEKVPREEFQIVKRLDQWRNALSSRTRRHTNARLGEGPRIQGGHFTH